MSESRDENQLVDYSRVPKFCPKCGLGSTDHGPSQAFLLRGYGVRAVQKQPTEEEVDAALARGYTIPTMQEFLAWGCKDCGYEVLSTTLDNSEVKDEQKGKASQGTTEV